MMLAKFWNSISPTPRQSSPVASSKQRDNPSPSPSSNPKCTRISLYNPSATTKHRPNTRSFSANSALAIRMQNARAQDSVRSVPEPLDGQGSETGASSITLTDKGRESDSTPTSTLPSGEAALITFGTLKPKGPSEEESGNVKLKSLGGTLTCRISRRGSRAPRQKALTAAELKAMLDEKRNTNEELLRKVESTAVELEETKKFLEETKNVLQETSKKLVGSQEKMQNILEDKRALTKTSHRERRTFEEKDREATRKINDLETTTKRAQAELRVIHARLRATEEKQQQTVTLLEARTNELNSVQPFMTVSEKFSDADIISMTQDMNSEIFQAAAYITELIEEAVVLADAEKRSWYVERCQPSLNSARWEMGDELWGFLEAHHTEMREEPIPLQLAFQCLLSTWCSDAIGRWAPAHFGEILDVLYRHVRESEAQTIAGRWRAITLTNANMIRFDVESPSSERVIRMLIAMLFFCGWYPDDEHYDQADKSIRKMVLMIERMATQLKKATREGITAADIQVFAVPVSCTFKDNSMEDVYSEGPGRRDAERGVLCTVGLGLRRSIMKLDGERMHDQAEIILKAKVVLVSALEDECQESGRIGVDGRLCLKMERSFF